MRMNPHLREPPSSWRSRANTHDSPLRTRFATRPTDFTQHQLNTELDAPYPLTHSEKQRSRRYSFGKPNGSSTASESRKTCPHCNEPMARGIPGKSHKCSMLRRTKGLLRLSTDIDDVTRAYLESPSESSSSQSRSANSRRRNTLHAYASARTYGSVCQIDGPQMEVDLERAGGLEFKRAAGVVRETTGWDNDDMNGRVAPWGLPASQPKAIPNQLKEPSPQTLSGFSSSLAGALGKYEYAFSSQRGVPRTNDVSYPSNANSSLVPAEEPTLQMRGAHPSNGVSTHTRSDTLAAHRYRYSEASYTPRTSDLAGGGVVMSSPDNYFPEPMPVSAGPVFGPASLPSHSCFPSSPRSTLTSLRRSKSLPPNEPEVIIHQPQPIRPIPIIPLSDLSAQCEVHTSNEGDTYSGLSPVVANPRSGEKQFTNVDAYLSDYTISDDGDDGEEELMEEMVDSTAMEVVEVSHAFDEPELSPNSLLCQPVADIVRFYPEPSSPHSSSSRGGSISEDENEDRRRSSSMEADADAPGLAPEPTGFRAFPNIAVTGYLSHRDQPPTASRTCSSSFSRFLMVPGGVADANAEMDINVEVWCHCGCMGAKHERQQHASHHHNWTALRFS